MGEEPVGGTRTTLTKMWTDNVDEELTDNEDEDMFNGK